MPFEESFELIRLLAFNGVVVEYDGQMATSDLSSGEYTVHSFVFNPLTYPESNIELGVTSIEEISELFIRFGGSICGDLDIAGVPVMLTYCDERIDLELEKSVNNLTPREGEEVTFTIEVTNNSTANATKVWVVDRVPDGLTFSGHISDDGSVEALAGGTQILWTDLDIPAGADEILTFTAIVNPISESSNYKNVAEVAAADQQDVDSTPNNDDGDQSEDDEDSVEVSVQEAQIDLELIKTVNKSEAFSGERISFNINLANKAMVAASGVEVTDVIPSGYDLNSVADISHDGLLIGNSIVWSNLELNFFSSVNLSFSIEVLAPDVNQDYKNTAQVTAADQPDVDSTPGNDDGDQSEDDEDSATVTVEVPFIDLSLTKSVNNANPEIGDFVQFELTIRNDGDVVATGISVRDQIPEDGYDVGSVSNVNPAALIVGNSLVWSEFSLEPGNELVLSFDIQVKDGIDYKNIAEVTSANEQDIDSSPNNDDGDQSEDDEDFAEVVPLSDEICDNGIDDDGDGLVDTDDADCPTLIDLEVTKTVDELQPTSGDVWEYTITITNNGPEEATNIKLQDVTPDGINAMDITEPFERADGVITWTIPSLPPGDGKTFQYFSVLIEPAKDEYTNVVQVIAADQEDIDSTPNNDDGDQSEDDEASATIFPVIPKTIDLELRKYIEQICVDFGDRITFFIDVVNTSDMPATGIAVEDVLPDGINNVIDISHDGSGIRTINWTGLNLGPGELITLSYSALIIHHQTDFRNIAQIISADQGDVDSTPDNDDGDQSEDDEDSLTLSPGDVFDLELVKDVDNQYAQPGERVRFDITVFNKGCVQATGVGIKDVIPSGYTAIGQITDGGERNGNVIIWSDLEIEAQDQKTVSFTAEVVHFSINCDYVNVAEINAANLEDIDSTPDNDDGDQSEDDEDSAEVIAGTLADMELTMSADKEAVITGDTIHYTIKVCNKGPANATHVQIRDYLPEAVEVVGDLNFKGQLEGNQISWSNFTFVAGDCVELFVNAIVQSADANRTISNSAEIVLSDQVDPNSSPGNGETDDPEDDFAKIAIQHLVPLPSVLNIPQVMVKTHINTALFLEGAYNSSTGEMNTTLNKLGYLPGQDPISFFADPAPPGQPYNKAPWNYNGDEGLIYDFQKEESEEYREDVVDWILVSLRSDLNGEATVFIQAALLLKDGTIVNPLDADTPLLDENKDYYLVVQHRNHLPVMSPKKLEIIDGQISFDFRYNESYTSLLGSGQKDVDGVYCVFAANGDQFFEALSRFDINARDLDQWFKNNGMNSSYLSADFDMNGDVNVQDQIVWFLNNGVFSDVPK